MSLSAVIIDVGDRRDASLAQHSRLDDVLTLREFFLKNRLQFKK